MQSYDYVTRVMQSQNETRKVANHFHFNNYCPVALFTLALLHFLVDNITTPSTSLVHYVRNHAMSDLHYSTIVHFSSHCCTRIDDDDDTATFHCSTTPLTMKAAEVCVGSCEDVA